eukprot:TRINITY_DN3900_c0_g1_i1.p1 TRINITY_DN3900_c0_g1~~TRINITY_DN3900_c0_g1_i1.p1  ORF type:complete len:266 (-),score=55.79 TRINITY_DN3900_c0_g1_i1:71-868(-)
MNMGKVVVITGASDGIGRGVALRYAGQGASLVLCARSQEKLEKVQKECIEHTVSPDNCRIFAADVSVQESCQKLIQFAMETYKRIDILVLCAGVSYHNFFVDSDLAAFKQMMNVNYYGYLYCTYFALPHLRQTKGQIIVVSSVSGELGLPLRTGYCASKFAVNGLFEALRQEETEVSITLIMPSTVSTNMRHNNIAEFGEAKVNFNESSGVPVDKCVDIIMDSSEKRVEKVVFPFSNHLAILLKPWFPKIIGAIVRRKAGGQAKL